MTLKNSESFTGLFTAAMLAATPLAAQDVKQVTCLAKDEEKDIQYCFSEPHIVGTLVKQGQSDRSSGQAEFVMRFQKMAPGDITPAYSNHVAKAIDCDLNMRTKFQGRAIWVESAESIVGNTDNASVGPPINFTIKGDMRTADSGLVEQQRLHVINYHGRTQADFDLILGTCNAYFPPDLTGQ